MKYSKQIILGVALLLAVPAFSQKAVRLFVPKAGTLVELLTEEEANEITELALQGKINAVDIRHLRDEFMKLKVLDLSDASIAAYAGNAGTHPSRFYIHPANHIPAYAFCKVLKDDSYEGKPSLERIILSDKVKNIEENAFKGCHNLMICQINKKTPPILQEFALADSVTAVFIPLGSGDSYRQKKGWEEFAFVEGEPVQTTVTVGKLGSLASELVSKGVQPKEINFLTVKGKLDEADFMLIRDYMPNLVSVDLSECNATAIPAFTFSQKKYLLKIELPKQLKSIGQRAFSGCGRLCGTLVLPPTMTAIEYGAFMGCDRLRQVKATGSSITTLGESLFGEVKSRLTY